MTENKRDLLVKLLSEKDLKIKLAESWAENFKSAKNILFSELERFVSDTSIKIDKPNLGVSTSYYDISIPLYALRLHHATSVLQLSPQVSPGGEFPERTVFSLQYSGTKVPKILNASTRIVYEFNKNIWIVPNLISSGPEGRPIFQGPEIKLEHFQDMILEVLAK